jgi:D-ribulokinase
LQEKNVPTDTIIVSGGAGQSTLVRQLLADSTGKIVSATTSPEPVLLGSAILGAVAAGRYRDITDAMSSMSEIGETCRPSRASAGWHERRFEAFEVLQQTARAIRSGGC